MHFIAHSFPVNTPPRASGLVLTANGQTLDIRRHKAADYTSFECDGPVELTVTFIDTAPSDAITFRPLRHGVRLDPIADGKTRFTLPGPGYYQLEIPGRPVLYLYALAPAAPAPEGPQVRRFAAGQVHEAGTVTLSDGDILWIEPGAVVRGHIVARNATGVRIGGGGLLQGALWPEDSKRCNNVLFAHCKDVLIEDILITAEENWMILLGRCEDVLIQRVRQIGSGHGTDGIDIVGSKNVTINGCCLHNGDDNIVLKAIDFSANLSHPGSPGEDFAADVENVRVSDCVLYNTHGGSAMEIGYETRTSRIHDVRFENIDVLAVHEYGSVFGIHNGDRATVEDIHWRNIRVEHHYDKLIDFRVLKSRWNFDAERGRIRDVSLTNIQVFPSIYNAGYTLSVMAGYDADHPVENIRLQNFRHGSVHVLHPDQLDLVTRHAQGITFK
jgi:hypothetical protein